MRVSDLTVNSNEFIYANDLALVKPNKKFHDIERTLKENVGANGKNLSQLRVLLLGTTNTIASANAYFLLSLIYLKCIPRIEHINYYTWNEVVLYNNRRQHASSP